VCRNRTVTIENTRLQAENAELRRRSGMNSSNSHKPPSGDGYCKKSVTAALPKAKRDFGGQKGHQGKTLRAVEKADKVVVHLPKQCCHCGRSFAGETGWRVVSQRQVFDLPEPKLEVSEHQLGEIECCGCVQRGEYPAHVRASMQYGAGVRALVTKLDDPIAVWCRDCRIKHINFSLKSVQALLFNLGALYHFGFWKAV
jgi:hypothetical protein